MTTVLPPHLALLLPRLKVLDEPKILLLGGREKGARYNELLQKCADKGVTVIAYGENRDTLKQLCDEIGVKCQV